MKTMKKVMAMLLAVVMLASVLAACGDKEPAIDMTKDRVTEPQYGGHLNVQIAGNVAGFDPARRAALWCYMYNTCLFEPPLSRDAENQIAPGVCEYEVSEDMKVVKLWPREGVLFHDGTPVEAEDVKASIARACNHSSGCKRYLGPAIESMVVEDNVLTITFKRAYDEGAWSRLASYQTWAGIMPKEICEMFPNEEITEIEYCIGTGPYKITGFSSQKYLSVERFDGYVPVKEDRSGQAGIKHAYLDTITFHRNPDYSSGTMAMLSGEYDVTDVIEPEYEEMAKEAGIIRESMGPCTNYFYMTFNNSGYDNLCAKYPDLRKAVMAAIDMTAFAKKATDGAVSEVKGDNQILDDRYKTDHYMQTDWYGGVNQEAVDKYLDAARAQGYDDEPIQLVASSMTEVITMLTGYLDNAGINFKVNMMDSAGATEFTTDGANNWDISYGYDAGSALPNTVGDVLMRNFYVSEKRDAMLAELDNMSAGSDEYIAKWSELHKLMVEDCTIVIFGRLDWFWNHKYDLHCDYEGPTPYFFNAWWEHPEKHPSPTA